MPGKPHRGLSGLTIRNVAFRAQLSTGLVLFHFGGKDGLVLALLDWMLETTAVLHMGREIASIAPPLERLLALIRQEMVRLSSEPARIRLFFDVWNAGMWKRAIRTRMQRDLDRYREAFRPMAAEVLSAEPDRFPGVTAERLAAVAVSFIKGRAVQAMIEPDLDVAGVLTAVEGLIEQRATHGAAT